MGQTNQRSGKIMRSYERYLSATVEDAESVLCDTDGERELVSMCQSGGLIGIDRDYRESHGSLPMKMVSY